MPGPPKPLEHPEIIIDNKNTIINARGYAFWLLGGLLLGGKHLDEGVSGEALGALEGEAEGSVPDETGERTQCSADTKENRVILLFNHSIVLLNDKRCK